MMPAPTEAFEDIELSEDEIARLEPILDAQRIAKAQPEVKLIHRLIERRQKMAQRHPTQDELILEVANYIEWNTANPIYEQIVTPHRGKFIRDQKAKVRVLSMGRFCDFHGIFEDKLADYEKDPELKVVLDWLRTLVRRQKMENASVDMLNANFIARDLGLAEKSQHVVEPTAPPEPTIDERLIANLTHPDDPDPTGVESGIFPRPLYSQSQIDAGVPFTPPERLPETIEGTAT